MRIVFLLLLFVNLAFAIYVQLEPGGGAAAHATAELHPEKLKLLPALARSDTCLEWGTFVEPELEKIEAAISRHDLDNDMARQATGMAPFYWVYFPPLRNRQHVERKIGELTRLGITDFTHVQGDAKWNNAISMGFFDRIEDARAHLASLRGKGVRTAVIGARNLAQIRFVARSPSESVRAKAEELSQEFPGSVLRTTECERRENGKTAGSVSVPATPSVN